MELILVLAAEAEGKEATWKAEVSQKKGRQKEAEVRGKKKGGQLF